MSEKTTVWSFARMVIVLTVICTLVAALLSGVYALTNERYEQNVLLAKQSAVAALYGGEAVETEMLPVRGGEVEELYLVSLDDELLGYCANVKSAGFGGDIDMMVASDAEGKLLGVRIVSMSETPGLGSRVENEAHLGQYRGLDVYTDVTLGKQLDAVSGATISSKAVNEGVRRALGEIRALFGTQEEGSPE